MEKFNVDELMDKLESVSKDIHSKEWSDLPKKERLALFRTVSERYFQELEEKKKEPPDHTHTDSWDIDKF